MVDGELHKLMRVGNVVAVGGGELGGGLFFFAGETELGERGFEILIHLEDAEIGASRGGLGDHRKSPQYNRSDFCGHLGGAASGGGGIAGYAKYSRENFC